LPLIGTDEGRIVVRADQGQTVTEVTGQYGRVRHPLDMDQVGASLENLDQVCQIRPGYEERVPGRIEEPDIREPVTDRKPASNVGT
jgi:hypothetical protein